MTSSAGASGLIRAGSPPRSAIASRMVARSTTQGTPVKSCMITPARVIMQDFTGVPCVVDLATMREAMADLGGDPALINPLAPAELVIDHSVQIDVAGRRDAFERNVELEYQRNHERYQFLRWYS